MEICIREHFRFPKIVLTKITVGKLHSADRLRPEVKRATTSFSCLILSKKTSTALERHIDRKTNQQYVMIANVHYTGLYKCTRCFDVQFLNILLP